MKTVFKGGGGVVGQINLWFAALWILGLLAGCTSPEQDAGAPQTPKPQTDELLQFETEDGKIEFIVQNKGNFTDNILKQIKEEILDFYGTLQKEKIAMPSRSKIYLNLYDDQKVSFHSGGTVNLYFIKEGRYPLIHELTHAFFRGNKGQVTQEGLAIYLQDTYSDRSVEPNYKEDTHEIMKGLMTKDIILPLETLLHEDRYFSFSSLTKDSSSLRWLAYIESASFSKYLINEYGLEKFLKIHGQTDLASEIPAVYGKSLEQLEGEWKQFVQDYPEPSAETVRGYEPGIQGPMNHLLENKERLLGG